MALKPWAWAGVGLFGAGAATLIAVAVVDLGKADQVASVTGGVVGLVGLALALVAQFGGTSTPGAPQSSVSAPGAGAIAAGGNIGTASTGGTTAPPAPAPPPPSGGTTAPGSVSASGPGSIAAGGDIGSASTGS
ncbi:hypothetical protein [Streptomyces guryensis]|uniref:Uncharacterized protein n=1 Tax=Streptomyces guryensis TaxID=2886947 RepID=A0A9Q3VQM9_9ACTN|nr:hypothetical protein [Streptomyces guryensis]MCD9875185.1 hypothetical protein [Streptomyces guryensis]